LKVVIEINIMFTEKGIVT